MDGQAKRSYRGTIIVCLIGGLLWGIAAALVQGRGIPGAENLAGGLFIDLPAFLAKSAFSLIFWGFFALLGGGTEGDFSATRQFQLVLAVPMGVFLGWLIAKVIIGIRKRAVSRIAIGLLIVILVVYLPGALRNRPLWVFKSQGARIYLYEIYKDKLFISDLEYVYALNAATGKKIWRTPVSNGGDTFNFNKNLIYFTEASGTEQRLVALDINSGKQVWSRRGVGSLGFDEHRIYFTDRGEKNLGLVALDINSGKQVWSRAGVGDISTVDRGKVYSAIAHSKKQNSMIFALDAANGKKLWQFSAPQKRGGPNGFIDNLVLFFSTARLYALDSSSGRKVWDFMVLDKQGSFRVNDGRIFVQKKAALYALDASGAVVWKNNLGLSAKDDLRFLGFKVYGKYVHTTNFDPLIFMDAKSGKTHWRLNYYYADETYRRADALYETHSPVNKKFFYARPPASEGKAAALDVERRRIVWKSDIDPSAMSPRYLADSDEKGNNFLLTIADALTGKIIKRFEYERPVVASGEDGSDTLFLAPVIYKDTVFVGTDDTLYAVSAKR